MSTQHASVATILGGWKTLGKRVSSMADFDTLVREGIPWASAAHAKQTLDISDREFAAILVLSPRTMARKKKEQSHLNLVSSDRLFRLARIATLATEVLEDSRAALAWLKQEQVGLNGRAPLDLIKTEAGARTVEDLLGRIEHGVVS